jgi:hypothetical protein
MDSVSASKLGGVAADDLGEDSSGHLPAVALGLYTWQVTYLHAAKKHGGRGCAGAANVQAERRALRLWELNMHSL